jgi:glycosyltransferase involved in cell wall biosynthesis
MGMISIVVACMNRGDILIEGIDNWLGFDWVDEIVVVDWSSDIPVSYSHSKVNVYRVEGESYWILSQAYNLSVLLAKGDVIVKCDSDYRLDSRINKYINPDEGYFYRGDWRFAKEENERHINGFFIMNKCDFDNVGGYNEGIVTFGFDDGDFYERLRASGCNEVLLSYSDGIYHKPHSSEMRIVNSMNPNLSMSESNELNRQYVERTPKWSPSSKKVKWIVANNEITRVRE